MVKCKEWMSLQKNERWKEGVRMPAYYWIAVILLMLVIELFTMGLTTIWFAGGAVVAAAMSLLGFNLPVQLGVFVGVSLILLFCTRPVAKDYLNSRTLRTNADSYIGKSAVVIHEINNMLATGEVQINGVFWSARSLNGDVIESGETVRVHRIDGVKLIVEKVKEDVE